MFIQHTWIPSWSLSFPNAVGVILTMHAQNYFFEYVWVMHVIICVLGIGSLFIFIKPWKIFSNRGSKKIEKEAKNKQNSSLRNFSEENKSELQEEIQKKAKKPTLFEKFAMLKQKKSVKCKQNSMVFLKKGGEYVLPPLELLSFYKEKKKDRNIYDKETLNAQADQLKGVLDEFGIKGVIKNVHPGPVVTLYELEPAAGVKSMRVISLSDDIARSMSSFSARVAVIPGKNAIGIELSNSKKEMVYLSDLLASSEYNAFKGPLALTLGKDIGGYPVICDLSKMPHLLVAGTTGSGKSVGINSMILSLLFRLSPEQCKFIMIDPKMLELSVYDGIPHLLTPVVTDPKKAIMTLKWVVQEMENRYRLMSQLGVRNIEGYNAHVQTAKDRGQNVQRYVQVGFDEKNQTPLFETQELKLSLLPFIVVMVDEMADLMLVAGKDLEIVVQRLAQMARAAGIHLIMATQRPSVDVITGTIKANFPTRISFQVTSKIDSRTILGEQGAEQLLGNGDMLYMATGGRIMRVHGPFVSDEEIQQIVGFLKKQGTPEYVEIMVHDEDNDGGLGIGEQEELFQKAVEIIRRDRRASTSYLQRQLQIGYNRAARLMEQMEKKGIVSPSNHVGKREILS